MVERDMRIQEKDKYVLVAWSDSKTLHGWNTVDYNELDVAHCQTVGILKRNDKDMIAVAQTQSDGMVLEIVTIPRGCIISIKELRIK